MTLVGPLNTRAEPRWRCGLCEKSGDDKDVFTHCTCPSHVIAVFISSPLTRLLPRMRGGCEMLQLEAHCSSQHKQSGRGALAEQVRVVWSHDLTDIFHFILGAICLAKSDSLSKRPLSLCKKFLPLYFYQTVYHRSVFIYYTVVDLDRFYLREKQRIHHKMFVFSFSLVV